MQRWLTSFPSFGFILAVQPRNVDAVVERFAKRGIAWGAIGHADGTGRVRISDGHAEVPLWDFAETALIGCGAAEHATVV